MQRFSLSVVVSTVVTSVALLSASQALACGACMNSTPPPPPGQQNNQYVVQNAERVLFLRDEATKKTTVWVEVRYSGAASDFGWVLPLPKQPKVGVGTRVLFDRLDTATAPIFKTTYDGTENCRSPQDGCVQYPRSFADAALSADAAMSPQDGVATGGTDPNVQVLDEGATGPYDYVVIAAATADPLNKWLNDHGYKTPDKAKPILQTHITKGDVFVAIKLSNGAGIDQIRPIVLTMDDAEPCVPLRLTSIAAAEEMTVVVTLGGKGRAIPKNALHVRVNPLRLNWYNAAGNYPQVVAAALDEAAGNAFVTEFGGAPASIIDPLFSPTGIIDPLFSPGTQTGLGQVGTLKMLGVWAGNVAGASGTELADDIEGFTQFGKAHGLSAAQALVTLAICASNQYVFNGETFGAQDWAANGCTATINGKQIKVAAAEAGTVVDGKALLASAQDHFFKPIEVAKAALGSSAMVTRLVMRISPSEMDRDPVFAFNPTLPPVTNQWQGTFKDVCPSGWLPATQSRLTVAGAGSWVFSGAPPASQGGPPSSNVGNNALDPRFKGAPAALSIELLDETGAPVVIDPSQSGLVSAAVAGALPGKPSLPTGLTVKKAEPWPYPANDAPVTKIGVWSMPPGCTALQGWHDGQLPPDGKGDAVAPSDAQATDGVTTADGGGSDGGVTQPSDGGVASDAVTVADAKAATTTPAKSGGGCSGSGHGAAPLASMGVAAVAWLAVRRRQVAR